LNNNENKDMDKRFLRVCLCNCNTGKYIVSMSKQDIEYIYQAVIKSSSETGDWITDSIKEDSLKTLAELKSYLFEDEDEKEDDDDLID
jgi:hypothetical protein